mmetsp:Transcript_7008/g.15053  ORF Transcript_7008/g.15053 Transcript_7008/m.15053 type:complete len:92 (-) Transcript_7008:727-1002(-)
MLVSVGGGSRCPLLQVASSHWGQSAVFMALHSYSEHPDARYCAQRAYGIGWPLQSGKAAASTSGSSVALPIIRSGFVVHSKTDKHIGYGSR